MSKQSRVTQIGSKMVLQADAPSRMFTIVFEDDGDTGYAYALAPTEAGELELLDALHLWNAEADLRGKDVKLVVEWSADSQLAALRVNGSMWALFDFGAETGWTRSNFPPPAGKWRMGESRPDWSDTLVGRL
jgi:hypothetical protein